MLDGVCAHRTYAKQGFSWWGITAELHKEDTWEKLETLRKSTAILNIPKYEKQ